MPCIWVGREPPILVGKAFFWRDSCSWFHRSQLISPFTSLTSWNYSCTPTTSLLSPKKIVKTYEGDDPLWGTCARLAWLGLVPPALPGLACGALWSTKLHTSNRSQNMDWVPCYHPDTARTATFFVPQMSSFHQEWKIALSMFYYFLSKLASSLCNLHLAGRSV